MEPVAVGRQALVRVDGVRYSVPSHWSGAYVGVADIVLEWCQERITVDKKPCGTRVDPSRTARCYRPCRQPPAPRRHHHEPLRDERAVSDPTILWQLVFDPDLGTVSGGDEGPILQALFGPSYCR